MDTTQRDCTQKTLLFYAVAGDATPQMCENLDSLLQKQDAFGTTALMFACKFGKVEWIQYLVEDESGFRDMQGRGALMYSIGALSQLQGQGQEYIKFSDPEVEIRLKIIDFLFDYEWHILDNNGQTCIDYLKQTKIDHAFIQYIEDKFYKNCVAFGTPKGVLLNEQVLKLRFDDERRGQNPQIVSIYQKVQDLQNEVQKWKAVVAGLQKDLNVTGLQEQVQKLQQQAQN